jgi:hypothetical protein
MFNAFESALSPPAAPSFFDQTAPWYGDQRASNLPPEIFSVPGTRNVWSQADPYRQTGPWRDLANELGTLRKYYTILDNDRVVMEFLEEESVLYTLLVEAVRPLQIAFGERRLFHIRVQHSEDDSLLKVAVQWPANSSDDPERALTSFDTNWWLNNCQRSGGALVFDYEIRDAV